MASLPGWSCQGDNQRLEEATDVAKGVFPGEHEEKQRQQNHTVDEQACQYSDEVHAQLLRKDCRIMHVQDFPSNQEYDSKREIPA